MVKRQYFSAAHEFSSPFGRHIQRYKPKDLNQPSKINLRSGPAWSLEVSSVADFEWAVSTLCGFV